MINTSVHRRRLAPTVKMLLATFTRAPDKPSEPAKSISSVTNERIVLNDWLATSIRQRSAQRKHLASTVMMILSGSSEHELNKSSAQPKLKNIDFKIVEQTWNSEIARRLTRERVSTVDPGKGRRRKIHARHTGQDTVFVRYLLRGFCPPSQVGRWPRLRLHFSPTTGFRQASNHDRTASVGLFSQDTRVCWSLLSLTSLSS